MPLPRSILDVDLDPLSPTERLRLVDAIMAGVSAEALRDPSHRGVVRSIHRQTAALRASEIVCEPWAGFYDRLLDRTIAA